MTLFWSESTKHGPHLNVRCECGAEAGAPGWTEEKAGAWIERHRRMGFCTVHQGEAR